VSAFERVVCGTELTEADHSLEDAAAGWARTFGAELVLVHASPPAAIGVADVPSSTQEGARALARRIEHERWSASEALSRAVRRVGRAELRVRGIVADGRPSEALVELADAVDGTLLVVGARPRAPLGRTIDHVLRHARSPVLAIPAAARSLAGGLAIVVAFDASEAATHALVLGSRVAHTLGGTLHAVHAAGPGELHDHARIEAEVRTRAPGLVCATITTVGVETSVADAVVREATRIGAGLVVIGSHARRGLARVLLGSTAEALLHRAETAVLVVR
jgi:nucleotide-binding universal stress UspA family protein